MGNAGYGNHTEDLKPDVSSEQPNPDIRNLPENATQPGEAPKGMKKPDNQSAGTPEPSDRMPPAGPHADPKMMNPDATPGTGALTPAGKHDDIDSTSG